MLKIKKSDIKSSERSKKLSPPPIQARALNSLRPEIQYKNTETTQFR